MVKIARTRISTSNGHNFQKKKDIGYLLVQNSRLSRNSFTLFRALSVGKVTKKGVPGGAQWGSMAQNMPLGPLGKEKKENLLPHQK